DGDVIRMRKDALESEQVVIDGTFHGGGGVLAYVQTKNSALLPPLAFPDIVNKGGQSLIVESQAVDQRLGTRQAKHAWLGVARLGQRRDGAHLDKAETQIAQGVDMSAVLVQACRQADRVVQAQAHEHGGMLRS